LTTKFELGITDKMNLVQLECNALENNNFANTIEEVSKDMKSELILTLLDLTLQHQEKMNTLHHLGAEKPTTTCD
jgi:hypothetical protein